jgi:hypothetical protein
MPRDRLSRAKSPFGESWIFGVLHGSKEAKRRYDRAANGGTACCAVKAVDVEVGD